MSQVHDDVHALSGPAAIEAMNRLFELTARLADATEHGLDKLGLTLARATVIWHVNYRGPMTQRELSEVLGVTPRNVTGLVDALESTGFVARAPHPTDRRATLVTLTEQGHKIAALRDKDYQEFAARLFGDVPADDLAVFITTADHVLGRLRDEDSGKRTLTVPDRGRHTLDIIPDGTCQT